MDEFRSGDSATARRMAGWASNLLASGVVLIGALVFGRQAISWWGQPRPLPNLGELKLDDPSHESGRWIDFNEHSTGMRRESFAGDRQQTRQRLLAIVRTESAGVEFPDGLPDEAETTLLTSLANQTPLAALADGRRIYQLDGPVPLAVCVGDVKKSHQNRGGDHQSLAAAPRVLCWGLALGLDPRRWTIFTFAAAPAQASQLEDEMLPPAARRTLSLRTQRGAATIVFHGPGQLSAWMKHFEKQFLNSQPPAASGWQKMGDLWYARFADARGGWIDVQLTHDGERQLSGLLNIMPRDFAEP